MIGRLVIVTALVWAGTMLGVAVVVKVSDNIMWAVFVLLAGWMLSGAAVESACRSLVETRDPSSAAGCGRSHSALQVLHGGTGT